ncbi:MAG: ABC transporter ATP-binding protein [Ilumatobacteraceae bacterium]|nr:ABC transporter ATP-binding protein [Ilumatobacteraceae bacterium]
MTEPAIVVESVSKNFRLYHERNRYIKAAILRGRRARYEEFWALEDVSFEVEHGSTLGLIGSNGSGKSTMLKCLTGIYRPDKGRVTVNGNVAALLELGAGFHPELTGRENIYLNAAILGLSKKDAERQFDSIVEFAGLERFINTPVKNYSSGMTIRLGFSIAAHVEPEILLIDEVLTVGDQSFQRKSSEKIEQFRREGRTIVVVSHSLGSVQQLCKEVIWLEKGRMMMRGPAAEVIAAYTGGSYTQHVAMDADFRERWGTEDVRIDRIELLNEVGEKIDRIETNGAMSITTQLTAQTSVRSPVIKVSISKLDGDIVWSSTSRRSEIGLGNLNSPVLATIAIPKLPLLEGTYYISVACTDATGTTDYDHCQNWVRFDVHQNDLFEEGLVAVPSNWTINHLMQ